MLSIREKLSYNPTEAEIKAGVIFRTGTYTTTFYYLKDIAETGSWGLLDEREQALIITYLTEDKTLDDLKLTAGVTSRERVRQIIRSGIKRTYRYAPPEIQGKYTEDNILRLKQNSLVANRLANLESRKQQGKRQWEERREEMTDATRQGVNRRRERIERGEIQPHKRRFTSPK